MKKIFLTGSTGYLGSHVLSNLKNNENLEVVVHNRETTPFNDVEKLKDSIKDCDIVLHIAGVKKGNPYTLVDGNLMSTMALLEALSLNQKTNVRFIYASSYSVYASNDRLINEDSPIDPFNFYGYSKLWAEKVLQEYSKNGLVQVTALRISNIYGPGEKEGNSSVIKIFWDQIKGGQDVTINGDGNQIRDFIYIDDASKAFAETIELDQKTSFETINICSGLGVSMNDLVDKIGQLTNKKPAIIYKNGDGAFSKFVGDGSKAKTLLGWKATTSLEEGLKALLT